MPKTVIRGNEATALGAKLCRPDVIPAYPITPSTLFPERISEYIADGSLDTKLVLVESEHSAMSACIGASATGARVCTATASQGLELMHEMLFVASGMRLPIVMPVGNRALSAPINIWCDHQDSISARDTGWLQFYAERNQGALDLTILAFKVAEDPRVLLPTMVGLDAFVLTHTMEVVDVPKQEGVDQFLPSYNSKHSFLDPKRPITIGSFGTPEYYMEFRYAQEKAMEAARTVIDEAFSKYEEMFGREYEFIRCSKCADAEIIIVAMGSMCGTARETVRKLRAAGKKVGLAKITVFRPFPDNVIRKYLNHAKVLAVVDRSLSVGTNGPVFMEVASSFANQSKVPKLQSFIMGLGGRDILMSDFEEIVDICEKIVDGVEPSKKPKWIHLDYEGTEEVR